MSAPTSWPTPTARVAATKVIAAITFFLCVVGAGVSARAVTTARRSATNRLKGSALGLVLRAAIIEIVVRRSASDKFARAISSNRVFVSRSRSQRPGPQTVSSDTANSYGKPFELYPCPNQMPTESSHSAACRLPPPFPRAVFALFAELACTALFRANIDRKYFPYSSPSPSPHLPACRRR